MQKQGRQQNPDVDNFDPDIDPGSSRTPTENTDENNYDIESPPEESVPLPPDVEKRDPVEEPTDETNDNAKRIVRSYE